MPSLDRVGLFHHECFRYNQCEREDRAVPATTLKRVILEILRKTDGEFDGKTRLYKACYFAHLYFFESHHGILTDGEFARMPQGPGIDQGDFLLEALCVEGLIECEVFHKGPYPEYRYRLTATGKQPADELPASVDLA